MSSDEQDPFLQKTKQALDDSAEQLDSRTVEQLNAVRRNALQQAEQTPIPVNKSRWFVWGPVGGLVTAAGVAALLVANPAVSPQQHMNDMELLTSEEDMALMEDIEFVAWLMEQEQGNAG